jgi:hypothetical protein
MILLESEGPEARRTIVKFSFREEPFLNRSQVSHLVTIEKLYKQSRSIYLLPSKISCEQFCTVITVAWAYAKSPAA